MIAALSLGLVAACSDDDEDEIVDDDQQQPSIEYSLSVSYADVDTDNIPAAGTTMTLEIASNVSWTVSSDSDWITCSPASGSNDGNVTLTIAENTSTDARTATVTVTGDPVLSDIVTITQLGAEEQGEVTTDPYLTVEPTTISVAAAGGTETITISSNVAWEITELDGVSDWYTIEPASGEGDATVTVTIAENTDVYNRSAYPVISSDSIEEGITLTIYQEAAASSGSGAYFTVVDNTVTVPVEGATVDSEGYGDVEFSVAVNSSTVVPTATCDNEAFTIVCYEDNPVQGYDRYYCYYAVTAAENTTGAEITGTITLTYEDQTETISIVQEAPETANVLYIDAASYFYNEAYTFTAYDTAWEMFYVKNSDESQVVSAKVDFGYDSTYDNLVFEARSSLYPNELVLKINEGAKFRFYTDPDNSTYKVVFKKIEFVVRSELDGCYFSADKGSCYYDGSYYETISSKMAYFQTWEAADSNTTEVTITATTTYNNYYAFRFTFDVVDSEGNVVVLDDTYTIGY